MADSERRVFLELELAAVQRLYDGEKARRETVRTSLAIPFASVTLIVLTIGNLVRFVDAAPGEPLGWLHLAGIAAGSLSVLLLLWALWLIYALDYAAIEADGLLLDLSAQAAAIEEELEESIPDPDIRQADAEFAAVQGAIFAYGAVIGKLQRSNEGNLDRQGRSLRLLVCCVGTIVLAIVLVFASRMSDAVGPSAASRATEGLPGMADRDSLASPLEEKQNVLPSDETEAGP
ncbi:hypothetical protein OCGS_1745 [Oceaniovalibus guishaninsula JLT2003]|uniref:Uncharacterized protein n=1 Tax=Oceaniovalibus guishaninsula JLT2003 TaxID=1231392 RepID=K2HN13_9RHOB|nr:hypothetical protein [Oceaniovalibus guishaninsula]EKE44229.1 hypothetical protein OCGS_1745 [Oceaniovalibus guishaninsula JLT2003]